MTFTIRLDESDPTPTFEQVRRQIAGAIASGELVTGTRIPSVRQFAADLDIAPGTVAKAYKELESAGLVTTARGAGTRLSGRPDNDADSTLNALAGQFVLDARRLGASDDAIRDAVERKL